MNTAPNTHYVYYITGNSYIVVIPPRPLIGSGHHRLEHPRLTSSKVPWLPSPRPHRQVFLLLRLGMVARRLIRRDHEDHWGYRYPAIGAMSPVHAGARIDPTTSSTDASPIRATSTTVDPTDVSTSSTSVDDGDGRGVQYCSLVYETKTMFIHFHPDGGSFELPHWSWFFGGTVIDQSGTAIDQLAWNVRKLAAVYTVQNADGEVVAAKRLPAPTALNRSLVAITRRRRRANLSTMSLTRMDFPDCVKLDYKLCCDKGSGMLQE